MKYVIVLASLIFLGGCQTQRTDPSAAQIRPSSKQRVDVSGRVLDPLRRPVPGVLVKLYLIEKKRTFFGFQTAYKENILARCTTDDHGRYSTTVPAGVFGIWREVSNRGVRGFSNSPGWARQDDVVTIRKVFTPEDVRAFLDLSGEELDEKMLGLVVCAEWDMHSDVLKALFGIEDHVTTALRKAIKHEAVRQWDRRLLSLIADPALGETHPIAAPSLDDAIHLASKQVIGKSDIRYGEEHRKFNRRGDKALVWYDTYSGPLAAGFYICVFHKAGENWVLKAIELLVCA